MSSIKLFSISFCILFVACTANRIITQINISYPPITAQENVKVFGLNDHVPGTPEKIGVVKIGNGDFSKDCGYDEVVNLAKLEASKNGGNAIKIIEHIAPHTERFGLGIVYYSCHCIKANILRISDFNAEPEEAKFDSSSVKVDFALIRFYRGMDISPLSKFNVYLDDSVVCVVKSNWRKTVILRGGGDKILFTKSSYKEELPLKIEIGKEYYIRCNVIVDIFGEHPKFEIVDNEVGKFDYESIKPKDPDYPDRILFRDGREYECKIHHVDSTIIYYSIYHKGKEIKNQTSNSEILEIQKANKE